MTKTPRPCTATCRDGQRCGNYARPGKDVCPFHDREIKKSRGPIDPIKILETLTQSKDHRVRLRAVDLLIELRQKEKLSGTQVDHAYLDNIFRRLTEGQRARVTEIVSHHKSLHAELLRIYALAETQPLNKDN